MSLISHSLLPYIISRFVIIFQIYATSFNNLGISILITLIIGISILITLIIG